MKSLSPFKIAVLVTVFAYLILNSAVFYTSYRYQKELDKFDTNQDGFFTNEEISAGQQQAMMKVTSDTGRNFAPFTLVPVVLLIGTATYFISRKSQSKLSV